VKSKDAIKLDSPSQQRWCVTYKKYSENAILYVDTGGALIYGTRIGKRKLLIYSSLLNLDLVIYNSALLFSPVA
jgi:hypothetical protein